MDIQEGAIYQLPNGRELVADATKEHTVLYNLSASETGQYQLNAGLCLMAIDSGEKTTFSKGTVAPPTLRQRS